MTEGQAKGYERPVRWGNRTASRDADPSAVYVFDAQSLTVGLPEVKDWLAGLPEGRVPLVAVVAPEQDEAMTAENHAAFETAMSELLAFPVSRPADDGDLLSYVSALLLPPGIPMPPTPQDQAPRSPVLLDFPPHAAGRADQALLRPIHLADRID